MRQRLAPAPELPRLVATALVGILILISLPACQPAGPAQAESITVGTVLLEPSALIFIAKDQHLFAQNGLDVTEKEYDSGLSATNALLDGQVDIASPVGEYVLAGKALENQPIQTIASIDKNDYIFILARKDREIKTPADLVHKRIGLVRGTAQEFYLGRFLDLHGISLQDVTLVNLTSISQAADTIVRGEVDAVISVQPIIEAAQDQLGDNALVWPGQSGQLLYSLLLGRSAWIKQHPQAVGRFLKALDQAESYVIQHPDEAKAILKKKLNLTDADIARIWSQNQFSLSLDQSLVLAMEDEARWMIRNDLATPRQMPDFLAYVESSSLEAIKPEAVNIIR